MKERIHLVLLLELLLLLPPLDFDHLTINTITNININNDNIYIHLVAIGLLWDSLAFKQFIFNQI